MQAGQRNSAGQFLFTHLPTVSDDRKDAVAMPITCPLGAITGLSERRRRVNASDASYEFDFSTM